MLSSCCNVSWVSDLEKLPGSAMWHVSIPRLRWIRKFCQKKRYNIITVKTSGYPKHVHLRQVHTSSCRHQRIMGEQSHRWTITLYNKALTKRGAPVLVHTPTSHHKVSVWSWMWTAKGILAKMPCNITLPRNLARWWYKQPAGVFTLFDTFCTLDDISWYLNASFHLRFAWKFFDCSMDWKANSW